MATHKTFVSLGKAIHRYGDRVEDQANALKIDTAETVARRVIENTPVDTGRARSNWIAKIGSPPSHTRRPFVPGVHLGRGERANLGASYAAIVGTFSKAKPGQPLYLKNNLKYITRLNEGYSKQSPAGFVQLGIQAGIALLRRHKLLE